MKNKQHKEFAAIYEQYKFAVDQWHYYEGRDLLEGETLQWLDQMRKKSYALVVKAGAELEEAKQCQV